MNARMIPQNVSLLAGVFLLLLNLADSAPVFSQTCTIPPPNLVGWWPGEGNAKDLTGGNDGILKGAVTFVPGKVGQAFSLPGELVGGENAIHIPDSGGAHNLDGFSQMTIDAWIKLDYFDPPHPEYDFVVILSKYNSDVTNGISYYLIVRNPGLLHVLVSEANTAGHDVPGTRASLISNSPVIPLGVFTHVAGVWKGNTEFELYVNGVQVPGTLGVLGTPPIEMADTEEPVAIGAVKERSGYVKGLIDEVEIFNRALSPEEIQAIFEAGSAGKCRRVAIDIKPGSDPNSVNLSSAGVIPVAIFGSETLDVTTLLPQTITLGSSPVKVVGKSADHLCHIEYVNGDSFPDLVCQIETAQTFITTGSGTALLQAQKSDGTGIYGEDSIRIIQDR